MPVPDISVEEVQIAVPEAADVQFVDKCGQKSVFSGVIDGEKYAIKFVEISPRSQSSADESESGNEIDSVFARVKREVEIISECRTPHMVKIGPRGLEYIEIGRKNLLFFTEEFIDGRNLKEHLQAFGPLTIQETVKLGHQLTLAIEELRSKKKIHRDIKPGNIMIRNNTNDFVLLDMGLAFDLEGQSLSGGPVGTHIYFSPEQMDFSNRRLMDFRSDLFSLGIVLYEMSTARHPFVTEIPVVSLSVLWNIRHYQPPPAMTFRADMPIELSNTILRLLQKRPSLRFRSPSKLLDALSKVRIEGGIE